MSGAQFGSSQSVLLPFVVSPIIAYTTIAYPLCLCLQKNSNHGWFYSHYINLFTPYNPPHITMNEIMNYPLFDFIAGNSYGGVPCIDYNYRHKDRIGIDRDNIFETFYNLLKQEYYIMTFLNFKHFSRKDEFVHNILINGIDLNKRKVYVVGYKAFNNNLFEQYDIGFDSFLRCYFDVANKNMERPFITLKINDIEPGFSYESVRVQIKDYLESKISADKFDLYFSDCAGTYDEKNNETQYEFYYRAYCTHEYQYGMACYNFVEDYLANAFETKNKDLRIVRLLKEHKNLMVNRLNYFHQNKLYDFDISPYIARSSEVSLNADALFFQAIKAICAGTMSFKKMYDRLQHIKTDEYEYLSKLAGEIQ